MRGRDALHAFDRRDDLIELADRVGDASADARLGRGQRIFIGSLVVLVVVSIGAYVLTPREYRRRR